MIEHLGSSEASVSVSIEEVPQDAWAEQVYRPDIAGRPELVYRKPGYSM